MWYVLKGLLKDCWDTVRGFLYYSDSCSGGIETAPRPVSQSLRSALLLLHRRLLPPLRINRDRFFS